VKENKVRCLSYMALQITTVNLDLMLDKVQVMKLPTNDTALGLSVVAL
jgi:hypothetical protein